MNAPQASLTVELRSFSSDDFSALVEIYMAAYREHPEYGEPTPQRARRYLEWLLRHHTFFEVAVVDQRPVGFIVVDTSWRDRNGRQVGEIHELAVDPAYWGKGIARQLLAAGLAHIRGQGLRHAGLWVGIKNERAQRFYRRAGFRPVDVRWGDWLRMERRL